MSSTLSIKELSSIEILTQITGQNIQSHHLTHRVMFLSAMATVLVGVTYADGQLAEQEKSYFQKVLKQFVTPEGSTGQMISLMVKGIRKHRIFSDHAALRCLAETLSESEKLLILSFGCKLAAVDGIVEKEAEYLRQAAIALTLSDTHVSALLSDSTSKTSNTDAVIFDELHYLLDPQRFQNIDSSVVNAASSICAHLPEQVKAQTSQVRHKLSYEKFEKFEGFRGQLVSICDGLSKIVKASQRQDLFPTVLEESMNDLSQRIQSQKFRLAIVGEFSQGKSTLLNALLGEEVQPTRAIPCSGALTTLKYGAEKRVTCYYKDGTQEVIPIEQYQEKASIPEEVALGDLRCGLAESNLIEIVLEHPGLELCQHHVEIIDSPGLNEHPDRTAITERLLKDTDAAIFLVNASRSLPEGERELLNVLKRQLKKESPDEPADNLFVLVNFMDLLRTEKDKKDVYRRIDRFLQGNTPLITGDNRIHFVSAQAALDAFLNGSSDEYSVAFAEFVGALETFLVEERGEIVLRKGIASVQNFSNGIKEGFAQTLNILEGKLDLSETEQCKIIAQVGEFSGFDAKIQSLNNEVVNEALEEFCAAWNEWVEDLGDRLANKTDDWSSDHEEKDAVLKDYAEQFVKDISEDLDRWLESTVIAIIIQPKLDKLKMSILQNMTAIKNNLQVLDNTTGTNLDKQFDLSMSNLGINMGFFSKLNLNAVGDATNVFTDLVLGGSGSLLAGFLAFTSLGLFPIILAGSAVSFAMTFLFSKNIEEVRLELKLEVFNKGIEQFLESNDEIFEKIAETVSKTFDDQAGAFHDAASASIFILSNLLEQQEKVSKEAFTQKKLVSEFIQQKSLELSSVEAALVALAKNSLT